MSLSNTRSIASLLFLLVLCTALACGGEEEEEQDPYENPGEPDENLESPPPEPPEDLGERCEEACARIYDPDGCGTLMVREEGGAMSQGACVTGCTEDGIFRGGEWCVATTAECRDDPMEMIEACFPEDYHHPHCSHLGVWPLHYEQLEDRAVELLNEKRAEGVTCPTGEMPAVGEVQMSDALLCAARLHSVAMVEEGFFSTTNTETGETTSDRVTAVGVEANAVEGVVNSGQQTAEQLVDDWITDSDRCAVVMSDEFDSIGVGRYDFERWTLKLTGNP